MRALHGSQVRGDVAAAVLDHGASLGGEAGGTHGERPACRGAGATMSACNYCLVRRIERKARKRGQRVVRRRGPATAGLGWNVYVVPKGGRLVTRDSADGCPSRQWRGWYMEIGDRCACYP